MKRIIAIGIVLAAAGIFFYRAQSPGQAPPGQPALVTLDANNIDTLKEQFNAAADRIRVVTLLSPT